MLLACTYWPSLIYINGDIDSNVTCLFFLSESIFELLQIGEQTLFNKLAKSQDKSWKDTLEPVKNTLT